MNRTHTIRLVDQSCKRGRVHATVEFHERGEHRYHWEARCHQCDWTSEFTRAPGPAVEAAVNHGFNHERN